MDPKMNYGDGDKGESKKGAWEVPSFGKLTVGPSDKFDQGSAYDAMNSEEEGIDGVGDLKNYGDKDA